MANQDKAERHLLVWWGKQSSFYSGQKWKETFHGISNVEEGEIRETRLLETFHWNSGTILATRNSNVVRSLRC